MFQDRSGARPAPSLITFLLAPLIVASQATAARADSYVLEEIDPTQFSVGYLDDGSLSISPSEADEIPGQTVEPGTYMGKPAIRRADGTIVPHEQHLSYFAFQAMSPNGKYATGGENGDPILFNLETGAKLNLTPLLPPPRDEDLFGWGWGVGTGVRVTNSGHALLEMDSGGIEGIVCSFDECSHVGINLPDGVTIKAFDLNQALEGIGNTNSAIQPYFFNANFSLAPLMKPPLYSSGYFHALNDSAEIIGTAYSQSFPANDSVTPPRPAIPSKEYPALWLRSDYSPVIFDTGQGANQIRFTAINNARIAVGSAKFNNVATAILFDLDNPALGLQQVKDLVPGFQGSLSTVRGINDKGTMLVYGKNASGANRHFLMRKVSPSVCRGAAVQGGSTAVRSGGTLLQQSTKLSVMDHACLQLDLGLAVQSGTGK